MNFFIQRSELRDIYDKVVAGERISDADALRLFESKDLNALGAIADFANQRKNGRRASYIINRYINYSNYCILSCQFCSFARKKRDKDGFELSTDQIVQKAREALTLGITELHIVGGLHPSLPFSYYTDMLRALRALDAEVGLSRRDDRSSGTGVSPVRRDRDLTGETPVPPGQRTVPVQGAHVFSLPGSETLPELAAGTAALRGAGGFSALNAFSMSV